MADFSEPCNPDATDGEPVVGRCPSWCVTDHREDDPENPSPHVGAEFHIRLFDRFALYPPYEQPEAGFLVCYLTQPFTGGDVRIWLGIGDSNVGISMLLHEAWELVGFLGHLINLARIYRRPATVI